MCCSILRPARDAVATRSGATCSRLILCLILRQNTPDNPPNNACFRPEQETGQSLRYLVEIANRSWAQVSRMVIKRPCFPAPFAISSLLSDTQSRFADWFGGTASTTSHAESPSSLRGRPFARSTPTSKSAPALPILQLPFLIYHIPGRAAVSVAAEPGPTARAAC
jgi:hypothetical protein